MGGRGGSSGLRYQGKGSSSGRASSNGVNVSAMKNRLSSLGAKLRATNWLTKPFIK